MITQALISPNSGINFLFELPLHVDAILIRHKILAAAISSAQHSTNAFKQSLHIFGDYFSTFISRLAALEHCIMMEIASSKKKLFHLPGVVGKRWAFRDGKNYVKISLIYESGWKSLFSLRSRLDVNVHDDVTLTAAAVAEKKTLRVNLFIIHEHTFVKLNI